MHRHRSFVLALAAFAASLAGCPGPAPEVSDISPDTANQFGHIEVTVTGANFAEGADLFVGGIEALFANVVDAGTLTATVQGAPAAGPADVEVVNPDGRSATLPGAFTYTPPVDPLFDHVLALGSSFSAGIQSNSFAGSAQLTGPLAHLMRAAGAYFPMPITAGEGLPPLLGPDSVVVSDGTPLVHPISGDVVSVPAGEIFNPADNINSTEVLLPFILETMIPLIINSGDPSYRGLLETGSVQARNLSVPAENLTGHLIGERIGLSAFGYIVMEPSRDALQGVISLGPPPAKVIAERDPTLVISTDVYGIDVVVRADIPEDTLRSFLFLLMLDLSTSEYYVAPDAPPQWPGVPFLRKDTGETVYNPYNEAQYEDYDLVIDYATLGLPNLGDLNDNGRIDETEVDLATVFAADNPADNPEAVVFGTLPVAPEILDENVDLAILANEVALELADLFPNVYVLDVGAPLNDFLDEARGILPPDVLDFDDDGELDAFITEFGGVRSLDGLHLTSSGYAGLANGFIIKMNEELGLSIPEIDLAGVWETEPLKPCNFTPDVRAIVGTPASACD